MSASSKQRPTEILYVIGSLDLGGTEHHLAQLAPALKRRGWTPVIYCLSRRGVLAKPLQMQGVEVIGPPFDYAERTAPIKALGLLASCIKLLGILLRRRPTIAHFFLPMAYVIAAPLAILARVPIRAMSRRSLNIYQNKHPIFFRLELLLHKHVHALLGNSKAVVAELASETGNSPRIGLIYNGVDLSEFGKALGGDGGASRSGNEDLTLVIVANLIPYKGHVDLFNALAIAARELPRNWKLLCVGRDDGLGSRLKELAHQLELDAHIQLLGQRQDISVLLRSSDIGLICSHEEGFSNAILEGMATGLPMIVTNVGGNAEAVVHGQTGLVVPARDPAVLGQAILTLAKDADLRWRMGQKGRQRVHDLFTFDRCIENYDKFYRALDNGLRPADVAGLGIT